MKMKKPIALMLTAVMTVGMMVPTQVFAAKKTGTTTIKATGNASGNAADAYRKKEEDSFDIYAFAGPELKHIATAGNTSNGYIQGLKVAGFTIAQVRQSYKYYGNPDDVSYFPAAISNLRDMKMKAYVHFQTFDDLKYKRFDGFVENRDFGDNNKKANKFMLNTKGYANVLGFDLMDEPDQYVLEKCLNFFSARQNLYNATILNLFPNYMDGYKTGSARKSADKKWDTYVKTMASRAASIKCKWLSTDNYPDVKNSSYDKDSNERRDYYYSCFSTIANYAKKYNLKPMNYVSLMDDKITPYTKSHITYQVNTSIAFGMRRLGYFMYISPELLPGSGVTKGHLVEKNDGTTTKSFNIVASINQWAYFLGNCLLKNNLTRVDFRDSSNSKKNKNYYPGSKDIATTYGNLGQVKPTSGSCLISTFSNSIHMITNGSAKKESVISVPNIKKKQVYCASAAKWVKVTEHIVSKDNAGDVLFKVNYDNNTITLPAGSAILIKG